VHCQMRYGSLFIIGTNNQHRAVCIKIMKYGNSSQLTQSGSELGFFEVLNLRFPCFSNEFQTQLGSETISGSTYTTNHPS
jgi:hypothetical protein